MWNIIIGFSNTISEDQKVFWHKSILDKIMDIAYYEEDEYRPEDLQKPTDVYTEKDS